VTRRRAALLVAGLSLLVLATGLFPQGPLRRRAEKELAARLGPGAHVRIGSLRIVPGLLSGELRDIRLEREGLTLQVDRVRARLSPGTLFGSLSVARLDVDAPRLEWVADTAPSQGEAGAMELPTVRHLEVHDGQLRLASAGLGELQVLDLDLSGGVGVGELEVSARSGRWRGPSEIELGPSSARIRLSRDLTMEVRSLDLSTPRSRLQASGTIGPAAASLEWSADLDLAELGPVVQRSLDGQLGITGKLAGPMADLRAEARAASDRLDVEGWPIRDLVGQMERSSSGTGVQLESDVLGGKAIAKARVGANVSADLQVQDLPLKPLLARLAGGPLPITGRLDASWSLIGPADAPLDSAGRLRASARSGSIELEVSGRGRGTVSLADVRHAHSWRVEVTAHDRARPWLQSVELQAEGDLRGAPLTLDAKVQGRVTLEGPDRPLTLELRGPLNLAGDVARAQLSGGFMDGPVAVDLTARPSGLNLSLRAESLELAQLTPDLTGDAQLRVSTRGPWSEAKTGIELSALGLAWRGQALGTLTATFEGNAEGGALGLEAAQLGASGRGRLDLAAGPVWRGQLELKEMPLDPLAVLLPEGRDLEGRIDGTIDLELPLLSPQATLVSARFDHLSARTGPLAVQAGRFGARLEDGRLALDGLELSGPGFRLKVDGGVPLPVAAEPLTLDAVVDLARLPLPEGWALLGEAHTTLSLSGASGGDGWLEVRDASLSGPGLPLVRVPAGRVELRGTALEAEGLQLDVGGGVLELSGRLPIGALVEAARASPPEAASLTLSWRDLELAGLLKPLGPEAAASGLGGSLTGTLELSGDRLDLGHLSGQLDLVRSQLAVGGVSFEVSPVHLELRDARLAAAEMSLSAMGGTFRARGSADLLRRQLDLEGSGQIELRALSPFLPETLLTGLSQAELRLSGPFDAPKPEGRVQVSNGSLRLKALPQSITGIEGSILLDGDRLKVERTSGNFGGGDLLLTGELQLAEGRLAEVDLLLLGEAMTLQYPEGLRSRIDTALSLTGSPGRLLLLGDVRAARGRYDLDLVLEQSLLRAQSSQATSEALRQVALQLDIETADPVFVRGQLGELRASGRLELRGDLSDPSPFGQLEILPGGKLRFQGRELNVESGSLVYSGTWNPELSAQATTRLTAEGGEDQSVRYRVTVDAEGPLDQPRLSFDSRPRLSEPEILSLLLTGRTDSQALGETAWLAGEQAASLLGSRVARELGEGLTSLGIDDVSIQPELVARETNPGARFTFGKRIGERVRLAYSTSLSNPEGRFIRLEVEPFRSFQLLGQRQNDGSLTFGAGQELSLGGRRAREAAEPRVRLEEVRFEGTPVLAEDVLRQVVRSRSGREVTAWEVQTDADRIRSRLRKAGHLEAEVGGRLEGSSAVFRIQPGPRYLFEVRGMPSPPDLGPTIRSALYEEEAVEAARDRLLRVMHDRGHLRAEVKVQASDDQGTRRVVFDVTPGPRLELGRAAFPGAHSLTTKRLLETAGGPAAFLMDPEAAASRIQKAYQEQNHLEARVSAPSVVEREGRLFITVEIDEGPSARLTAVRADGAELSDDRVAAVTGLELGAGVPDDDEILEAVQRLREHFFAEGFPDVRVIPEKRRAGPDVELVFHVEEGERITVAEIDVEGLGRTRESLVRGQLQIAPGDPLDPRELARASRRLQGLGVFSRAAVVRSKDDPTRLVVHAEERSPLRGSYQLRYNDESGARGELEAELSNLLGRGLALGGRYSRGRDDEDVWGSVFVPAVGPGNLTASLFRLTQDSPGIDFETGEAVTIRRRQKGIELQMAEPLSTRTSLLLGYSFQRSTVTFIEPVDVASLDASLIRDGRDSPLDPRRGAFLSASLRVSPKLAGSDYDYVKGMAQAFLARPIGAHLTWAHGYRLGLAHVFSDQPLVAFERFRAGGSNSVRGYARDSLGPVDFLGEPRGGQAVLVLNQELRFHHRSGVGAVVFYDAGNVFADPSELSLDLRQSIGAGLRYVSPVGLLRLDVAWPLRRREGEAAHQIHFSLGQAF
jgi:outer membrane protein insertion porin family